MNATPEITRQFAIDCGHRLQKHESKCRNLHGHRYTIEVTCVGLSRLDEVGRVIDFGVIKQKVGDWLDGVFDHGFIVEEGDPLVAWLLENEQKHVVLDCPPSIENLCDLWFHGAAELMAEHGIIVTRVRGYETPFCWADYTIADAKQAELRKAAKESGAEVYSRPECIFNYCDAPDACKAQGKCRNPRS
jgi:6-pyruvoyltetrahydropterin/6-carboxytetrahydropterin synthase